MLVLKWCDLVMLMDGKLSNKNQDELFDLY
jgi:hypothetical protein